MKTNTAILKNVLLLVLLTTGFAWFSCKKDKLEVNNEEGYTSTKDFLNKHKATSEYFTFNDTVGGVFTSAKGSIITVMPNSFVDGSGNPVTGNVTLEFKDVYHKSDMIFSDMYTTTISNTILKSGGMFFIRAKQGNITLKLNTGKKITVEQPLNGFNLDSSMNAFNFVAPDTNSFPAQQAWAPSATDTVNLLANNYIYSLYNFSSPIDSGTWCNSDNSTYFASYPQTSLTFQPTDDISVYGTNVFLVFPGINAMVHVYQDYMGGTSNFIYSYAPQGLNCTMIAIGVKGLKLYYAKKDITITSNLSTSFTLTEISNDDLISLINSLNS
jgi:hypothetical protein